jgi:hypothetical protein
MPKVTKRIRLKKKPCCEEVASGTNKSWSAITPDKWNKRCCLELASSALDHVTHVASINPPWDSRGMPGKFKHPMYGGLTIIRVK